MVCTDCANLIFSQPTVTAARATCDCPVRQFICFIFGGTCPPQIDCGVICRNAVAMSYVRFSLRLIAMESSANQTMDRTRKLLTFTPKRYLVIASGSQDALQNPHVFCPVATRSSAADAAHIADFIISKIRNRTPFLRSAHFARSRISRSQALIWPRLRGSATT